MKAMREFWAGFDAHNTYTHRVEINDDGTGKIFVAPIERGWLADFPLQFGEAMYQLRAALDSCVYDCAVIESGQNPPPDERNLQFPICATPKSFENCRGQIAPLSKELRSFIKSVQPYQTSPPREQEIGRILGILNDWARTDRHRTLPIIGAFPLDGGILLDAPPGVTIEWINTDDRRLLEDESHLATFKLGGFRWGYEIKVQLAFSLEIALDGVRGIEIISKAPAAMMAVVREVIREFESILKIRQ
ncbi:MAG: hypothetical protein ABSF17_01230 [Terracidiphilus sp.]